MSYVLSAPTSKELRGAKTWRMAPSHKRPRADTLRARFRFRGCIRDQTQGEQSMQTSKFIKTGVILAGLVAGFTNKRPGY
jgi:hypothetical protein